MVDNMDRRRAQRFDVPHGEIIRLGADEWAPEARILDISAGGARARAKGAPDVGEKVMITHPFVGSIAALTAWRRGDEIGLSFRHDERAGGLMRQCLAHA